MKKLFTSLFLSYAFILQAQAGVKTFGGGRYELVQEAGQVVKVRDLSLKSKVSVPLFIEWLKALVVKEQALEKSGKTAHIAKFEKTFFPDLKKMDQDLPLLSVYRQTRADMGKLNLAAYLADPKVQEVLGQFQQDLNMSMAQFDFTVVSVLDDSTYYFKRNFLRGVALTAANMAGSAASSSVAGSVAAYVITRLVDMLYEMKGYHQNILLHYLHTHSAESLGLTESERQVAISSVFEAMIPWWNFWEFYLSQQDFNTYGVGKIAQWHTNGQARLEEARADYSEVREELTIAHQVVVEKESGAVLIKDLAHIKSIFDWGPNESFNYSDPDYHFNIRIFYEVFKLALSAVPVPGVSTVLGGYIDTRYIATKVGEGVLYGHFEDKGDAAMAAKLLEQTVNPWDYVYGE